MLQKIISVIAILGLIYIAMDLKKDSDQSISTGHSGDQLASLEQAKSRSVKITIQKVFSKDRCFGVVANNRTIVTANHCIKTKLKSGINIILNDNLKSNIGGSNIESIYRIGRESQEDVAIIKLKTPLTQPEYQRDIVQSFSQLPQELKNFHKTIYIVKYDEIIKCSEHSAHKQMKQYKEMNGKMITTCNSREGESGAPIFSEYEGQLYLIGLLGGLVTMRNTSAGNQRLIYITELHTERTKIYKHIQK